MPISEKDGDDGDDDDDDEDDGGGGGGGDALIASVEVFLEAAPPPILLASGLRNFTTHTRRTDPTEMGPRRTGESEIRENNET